MAQAAAQATKREREGKYLVYTLNKEDYGIRITQVKEIIGLMTITQVPQTPPFVKGVINLRGKVIPVIDLRLRFGMPVAEYSERTCIVVVEVQTAAKRILMGLVVDAVSEVQNIRDEEIEETPSFGTNLSTEYILGMAKKDGGVKILLDIDKVLTDRELAVLAKS